MKSCEKIQRMGTYGLEGVWSAWKTDKLTPEQAVGQILQLLLEMDSRLTVLERNVSHPPAKTGGEKPGSKTTPPKNHRGEETPAT